MAWERRHSVGLRLREHYLVVVVVLGAVGPTAQPAVQLTEWEVAERPVRTPGAAEVSLEMKR